MLCAVTGLDACCLQPSAGAHGELTGIMLIQAWHRARGNKRTKMLIPDTAHGTQSRQRRPVRLLGCEGALRARRAPLTVEGVA